MSRRGPNQLPPALRALTDEECTGFRSLYLPEVRALCTAIRSGMKRPFPGFEVNSDAVPVPGAPDLLRMRFFIVVKHILADLDGGACNAAVLFSKPYAAGAKPPAIQPANFDKTAIHFHQSIGQLNPDAVLNTAGGAA